MAESTNIIFAGRRYEGEALTQEEQALLERVVFNQLVPNRQAWLYLLFQENWDNIVGAAQVAKARFRADFRGAIPSDGEFGVQLIRPGHILRTTAATETPANTWNFTFASGAASAWLGFSTSNGTALNIDREATVLILGAHFTQGNAPVVEEIQLQVGGLILPEFVIRPAWTADNVNQVRGARMPPILLPSKETVLGTVTAEFAGVNDLVLDGLTFGLGRYLRKTSYTTVTT